MNPYLKQKIERFLYETSPQELGFPKVKVEVELEDKIYRFRLYNNKVDIWYKDVVLETVEDKP